MQSLLTQNKELLSVIILSISGLLSLFKWIDSRNRVHKDSRFKTYMNLIEVISGKRVDSTTPKITEQIAATWFLLEFKEYYKITKRIFIDNEFEKMANEPWLTHVLPHIKRMIQEINK